MSAEKNARIFLDTNILIYALASDDPKTSTAQALLQGGGFISVQVLNEFVNSARRKYKMPWKEIQHLLDAVSFLCGPALALSEQVHRKALALAVRHSFSIYDANILASALLAGCTMLYSEDMQDGQQIEALTIRNPFTAEAP